MCFKWGVKDSDLTFKNHDMHLSNYHRLFFLHDDEKFHPLPLFLFKQGHNWCRMI